MAWNVSAEVIAFIIVLIISVYSRKSQAVPSHKNRLFHLCLITTLCAIGTNLASTLLIAFAPADLIPLTWIVTTAYFILTPMLGAAYFYYAAAVISETRPVRPWQIAVSALPGVLYALCVVANVATGWLFFFDDAGVYQRGPLILSTYLVFYFYCIACFALVTLTRAPIDPKIKRILAVFPVLAVVVIAVQQAFPTYLLSGSAAACSLLIIYLYLQNKRLTVDLLTGAANRQEFLSMVALLHRTGQPFTAVLVSLSNFKFINDRFGHETGDRFLREFAEFLRSFKEGVQLYRYSGDQFALIVDEDALAVSSTHTTLNSVLDALRAQLDGPWRIGGSMYSVTAAVSTVAYPSIAPTPGDVVAALEYTVEKAKEGEPNVPLACTPAMIEVIHRRSHIADAVRRAVKTGKLSVHYQPIWSEAEGCFITAEALCRLTDDNLGPISPDEFIPVAEKAGLIGDIAYFVLNEACAFVKAYRDEHPETAFRGVSVNFSAVQFMQDDLAEAVLDIVNRHDIPASCLRIELTESAIVANPDAVFSFMTTMHEHGVRFYLDDFGTGYSNVSTMLVLPFDIVKLDKSLLWAAEGKSGVAGLLEHLIAGFDSIDLQVLSEGVETERQRAYLHGFGCQLMQGYLFSKPLPPDEAAAAIAKCDRAKSCA